MRKRPPAPGALPKRTICPRSSSTPRRTRGDRGVEVEIAADLVRRRHVDLAERHGDAEPGGAVGDAHGFVNLAGHAPAPAVGLLHGVDGEQRRLGLDVVDIRRIGDAGIGHRRTHPVGDRRNHRRTADVLGKDRRAHRGPHGEPRRIRRPRPVVAGEDGGVRREHAVAPARPDHGDFGDLALAPRAVREQDAPEGGVREDAGEVVDPAVALGLADHGNHRIRRHAAGDD